jgi:hypothetical protein
MEPDNRMGPKNYAKFDKTFMLFGSMAKSFGAMVGPENWEELADAMWLWSVNKVDEYVETLYATDEPADASKPVEEPSEPVVSQEPTISEKQAKRFYAIAKGAGYTDEGIKRLLLHHNLESVWKITNNFYKRLCQLAEDKKLAGKYNHTPTEHIPR